MIIGSGLLARAFTHDTRNRSDVLIYAAGVSNSQCTDTREFARERSLLTRSLEAADAAACFVYFSTCSIEDPESTGTAYVQHKLAMEQLTLRRENHLVVRLPQIAGKTPNPHTLLNYLHARIARGERFTLWNRARRNIIDSDDVRALVMAMLDQGVRNEVVNVANTRDYGMPEVVETLERVCGGHAVYDSLDRGGAYTIEVSTMLRFVERAGVRFGDDYLQRILRKYYRRGTSEVI